MVRQGGYEKIEISKSGNSDDHRWLPANVEADEDEKIKMPRAAIPMTIAKDRSGYQRDKVAQRKSQMRRVRAR